MLKSRAGLLTIAGIALLELAAVANAATLLVVRSAGPSAGAYPRGKILAESARISLQSGDVLELLSFNRVRTLRGPGMFSTESIAGDQLALVVKRRTRFSAIRYGEIPRNPSPWNLDVTQTGSMCVADPAKLLLWRPYLDAATLSISGPRGLKRTMKWPAGQSTLVWPKTLKISNGAKYRINQGGESSDIQFVKVASAPTDLIGAAQVLIANECENQLNLLVSRVEQESE